MRTVFVLAVALLAAVWGTAFAGGNPKNPAPAGRPTPTGPAIIFLAPIPEKEIPDYTNSAGTYTSIDEFRLAEGDAGIGVNVKPGGGYDAHFLLGYEIKTIPAKKDRKGRVIEPEKKVLDPTRPLLKAYVPQSGGGGDTIFYRTFTYMSEAQRGIDWGAIKGMVSASPGSAIPMQVNGVTLGLFLLGKDRGGFIFKVFKVNVKLPAAPAGENQRPDVQPK